MFPALFALRDPRPEFPCADRRWIMQSPVSVVFKDSNGVWQGRHRVVGGLFRGYVFPIATDGEDARRLFAELLLVPIESVKILEVEL